MLRGIVFLCLAALLGARSSETYYHTVFVQHFTPEQAVHNDHRSLSVTTTTLQDEVNIVGMYHKYAHEVIGALTAGCTTHSKTYTRTEKVDTPIETFIFLFNEADALALPWVRLRLDPPPPATPSGPASIPAAGA